MYLFVIVCIIFISFIIYILLKKEEEIDTEKILNDNVEYYVGRYKGEEVKISNKLDKIYSLGNKKANLKDSSEINSKESKFEEIKNKSHPVYHVLYPVYKPDIKEYRHNIPKNIFQTCKHEIQEDSELYPLQMTFKSQEGWNYQFYDDKRGYDFIKENFHEDILHSYEVLKPGAYKADLLRVCLVYIYGGVYADIKLRLNCKLDKLMRNDLVLIEDAGSDGIWNGFFASIPKNPFLMKIINRIVENVRNLDYTDSSLGVTGPKLWMRVYQNEINKDVEMFHFIQVRGALSNFIDNMYLTWNQKTSKYRKLFKSGDYGWMWITKDVFDLKLHKEYFRN